MRDHPDIERIERYGHVEEPRWPRCPVCNEECETIYLNGHGEPVGCDECLESIDAADYEE